MEATAISVWLKCVRSEWGGNKAFMLSHVRLWPFRLQHARLLCPWEFSGKNTGVGCHVFLQGIFPTQGKGWEDPALHEEGSGRSCITWRRVGKILHSHVLHYRQTLLLSHRGREFKKQGYLLKHMKTLRLIMTMRNYWRILRWQSGRIRIYEIRCKTGHGKLRYRLEDLCYNPSKWWCDWDQGEAIMMKTEILTEMS